MSLINFDNVYFNYKGYHENVLEDFNISIDTQWKTGVVARNGYGKTTILKLINRDYKPSKGTISVPIETYMFPLEVKNAEERVMDVIKDIIGPFRSLEKDIESYNDNDNERYIESLEKYLELNGYEIESLIEKEISKLNLSADILDRSYLTLSGGEQTKVQIVGLFLKANSFILLDEPTNHLDIEGIKLLAEYLSKKEGYIVVSHNRDFLDICIDHVLYINKTTRGIEKGNYSSWEYNQNLKLEFEQKKKERIVKDVKVLENSARQRRDWSDKKEKEKIGGGGGKGAIGAQAARLMKRALNIERRIDKELNEKKQLLKDFETTRTLKLSEMGNIETILDVAYLTIARGERTIINNLSFRINKGDRVGIKGPNGVGKTTLIQGLLGQIPINSGIIKKDSRVEIAYSAQFPKWTEGFLRDYLISEGIDETRFRSILGCLGAHGEIFERDLKTFSLGELKKVDLAYCFYLDNVFHIWDEPLNGLDINSRKLLEDAILKFKPTILFIEHDSYFIERVATDIIELKV